ncbi:MAG: hypothetical protein HKM07_07970 [Chlamydiae bacterium]|nr:hypothetical protein [Chlamydiota bacterium]
MGNNEKRKPSYQDILIAEKRVQDETQITFVKWFEKFKEIINLFFEISYLKRNHSINVTSSEYSFYWYAKDIYTEIPCSLRSCSLHLETGYYTNALDSCRALLETLVKLKYFFNHKDSISPFFNTGKDEHGKKIKIKTFFEKATPIAYEKNYSFLCKFVHKDVFTSLPSLVSRLNSHVKKTSNQEAFLPLPTFSKSLAEIVIKHLLALISGYLNAVSHFFSYELTESDSAFLATYENLKKWVNNFIQANKVNFPNSKEWSELMEEIAEEPQPMRTNESPQPKDLSQLI